MKMKKTHKRKKSSRMHGHGMGTHGTGARKKSKGKGHRGGKGMSGSGKRADHKKTFITKKYGHRYFGKKGLTSRSTKKDKRKRINLSNILYNPEKYGKKTHKGFEINLNNYKILGDIKNIDIKDKFIIYAKEASKSAIEKIKKANGEIILLGKNKKEDKKE